MTGLVDAPLIAVAVITRDRPVMFARLLDALGGLDPPLGARVQFVLVENGPAFRHGAAARALERASGCRCHTLAEPRLGIPLARNAALDCALRIGATHLAFIDDDELPARDWLHQLWRGKAASDAALVSGPVLPTPEPGAALSLRGVRILAGLRRCAEMRAARNRMRAETGQDGGIVASTNNWLCDLAPLRAHGLRFRDEIGLSGGSDTAFWHDLRALGGQSAWVPGAVVTETLPASRLTLAAQLRRARHQTLDEWRRRIGAGHHRSALRSVPFILTNLIRGAVQLVLGLVVPVPHLAEGARHLGRGLGRLDGLRGRPGHHYGNIDGH
ncbi:MAG: glycosyltransferase family 2 protein [Gemmobacter sp.]